MQFNRVKLNNTLSLLGVDHDLTSEEVIRLKKIQENWNFYEGFHWEDIPQTDKPQVTENYCRPFVNKFVAFEFSKSFKIEVDQDKLDLFKDETNLDFLNSVWEDSKKDSFCLELGQSKSISGDAWVQVRYYSPDELNDPFGEYPKGKILATVIPTEIVFATYNSYDKRKLEKVTIAYTIEKENISTILRKTKVEKVLYKQIWTENDIVIMEGNEVIENIPNKYKVIPFVQIKNFPRVGKTCGISDLEDLIPLNVELNIKKSDVSEIIDYHSAPVTVVYGARVSQLEKGANKIWGGLPKDARVQNLELNSDLGASINYINDLKKAMHEIGGVPIGALGGEQAISNTSGVALQFVNMPLVDRTKVKKAESRYGLQQINKLILYIALLEKLIIKPENMSFKDFFTTKVVIPDGLPKDDLIELQKIETEMRIGIESKEGAMKRVGVSDIEDKFEEIQKEKEEELDFAMKVQEKTQEVLLQSNDANETFTNNEGKAKKLNSGFTNSSNKEDVVNKELNS